MNVLSTDVKNLSNTVLWVINTHVPVNNDLMLHFFPLNREANCGLLRDLVIAECVLFIVLEFNEKAEGACVFSVELRRMKLCYIHVSLICVPSTESSTLGHHEEMSHVVAGWEMLQELQHGKWLGELVVERSNCLSYHINKCTTVTAEAHKNTALISQEIQISQAIFCLVELH